MHKGVSQLQLQQLLKILDLDGLFSMPIPLDLQAALSATSTGNIKLTGRGGDTGADNDGILIDDASAVISSGSGNIRLTGNGGNSSFGIHIAEGTIETIAAGNVILNTPDVIQMAESTTIDSAGRVSIDCDGLNLLTEASITAAGDFNLIFGGSGL